MFIHAPLQYEIIQLSAIIAENQCLVLAPFSHIELTTEERLTCQLRLELTAFYSHRKAVGFLLKCTQVLCLNSVMCHLQMGVGCVLHGLRIPVKADNIQIVCCRIHISS